MPTYINDVKVITFFTDAGYAYIEDDFRELDCGILAYFHKGNPPHNIYLPYKEAAFLYNAFQRNKGMSK